MHRNMAARHNKIWNAHELKLGLCNVLLFHYVTHALSTLLFLFLLFQMGYKAYYVTGSVDCGSSLAAILGTIFFSHFSAFILKCDREIGLFRLGVANLHLLLAADVRRGPISFSILSFFFLSICSSTYSS